VAHGVDTTIVPNERAVKPEARLRGADFSGKSLEDRDPEAMGERDFSASDMDHF
jgi:hypothetical protein